MARSKTQKKLRQADLQSGNESIWTASNETLRGRRDHMELGQSRVGPGKSRPTRSERAAARKNPTPIPGRSENFHAGLGQDGRDSRGNYQGNDLRHIGHTGMRGYGPPRVMRPDGSWTG